MLNQASCAGIYCWYLLNSALVTCATVKQPFCSMVFSAMADKKALRVRPKLDAMEKVNFMQFGKKEGSRGGDDAPAKGRLHYIHGLCLAARDLLRSSYFSAFTDAYAVLPLKVFSGRVRGCM